MRSSPVIVPNDGIFTSGFTVCAAIQRGEGLALVGQGARRERKAAADVREVRPDGADRGRAAPRGSLRSRWRGTEPARARRAPPSGAGAGPAAREPASNSAGASATT